MTINVSEARDDVKRCRPPLVGSLEALVDVSSVPTVKPSRPGMTAGPVVIGAVTPESLADIYNREADGRDPISFFHPYSGP